MHHWIRNRGTERENHMCLSVHLRNCRRWGCVGFFFFTFLHQLKNEKGDINNQPFPVREEVISTVITRLPPLYPH